MSHLLPEGESELGSPQKPNSLLRIGIYVRKSNKTEGRSKSIAEQIEFCKQVCRYYGFSEDNIIIYEEAEGQKGEWYWEDTQQRNPKPWRPQLTRLMNDIAGGKLDVLVIWRSDRLIRDNGVGDAVAKELRRCQTRILCGHRDMAIDTATGLYQFNVEAANNRRYRDQTSEDIRRDQEFKKMLGLFTRNPSCHGFRSKGKGTQAVIPMEDELAVVNRIFRMFVVGDNGDGPLGINAICDKLMDDGVVIAVGAKGHTVKDPNKIYTSRIRTILTNCMYIGKFRHNKQEYDCKALLLPASDGSGKFETAVPIALYEAAQEKLKLTDRPGKKSAYSEHLVSGLAICAYCGRPLHVRYEPKDRRKDNPRPPSRWYTCSNRKPPRYCKPYGMRMLQEDVLDDWVTKELAPLLVAEMESIRSAAGRDGDTQALAEIERTIDELRKKETQTLRDMVGILDKEQITTVAADFRGQREQLTRKAAEIRLRLGKNADLPDLSAEALIDLPKSAIKDALRRVIQWIAIGKDGIVILTRFGTYIGATFRDIEKGTYYTAETRTTVYPPTPDACLRCLQWLPSPEDFIKGRRASMGRNAEVLTDAEILPGLDTLATGESIDEVEIIIEEVDLDD